MASPIYVSLILIIINYIISSKQIQLFFAKFQDYLLQYLDDNIGEESE